MNWFLHIPCNKVITKTVADPDLEVRGEGGGGRGKLALPVCLPSATFVLPKMREGRGGGGPSDLS